jgi:hypothetical protein
LHFSCSQNAHNDQHGNDLDESKTLLIQHSKLFSDETVLSIGANSELAVNEYVFNPDQSRFSFVVKMVRGTAAYMSGLIAKISPESARFITPSASIGIRGTKMVIQVENDKGIL